MTIETTGRSGTKGRRTAVEVFAAAVIGVCLFGQLGAVGLLGPDEPRYAWIARAMAETGDWVTPRLYGLAWFEKPVLYYWFAAAGFKLGLSAEWAARLPSALAALAATVAVGWLARRYFSEDAERGSAFPVIAATVFATSVAAIGFARAATPDMLFSASITLAMACAAALLLPGSATPAVDNSLPSNDLWTLVLFGAFLGLGVLAKGPAAVILAGGALLIWTTVTGNWIGAIRLGHPAAIAAFCVVALPWYLLCALRNPDFLHVFIFEHNFQRYLTPMFQHIQPFWFFIPIALLAMIPWVGFLAAAAWEAVRAVREKTWRESPEFFFACWALFPIFFFSVSKSKLPSYILPGMPALALLATAASAKLFARTRPLAIALASLVGLTWAGLMFTAEHKFEKLPAYVTSNFDLSAIRVVTLAIAVTILAVLLICGAKRNFTALVAFNALLVLLTVEAVNTKLLPAFDPLVSARVHGLYVARNPEQHFYTYELARSWVYGIAFYAHRELPEWTPQSPDAGIVLTNPRGYDALRNDGEHTTKFSSLNQGILYVTVPGAAGTGGDNGGMGGDTPAQGPLDQQR